MKTAGLDYKAPKLIHITDEYLNELEGLKFDIIWAQSVFTHMPPEDIQALLLRLRAHMHPHSVFYATIATTQGESHRSIVKDFYYNVQFFFDSAMRGFRDAMTFFVLPAPTPWRRGSDFLRIEKRPGGFPPRPQSIPSWGAQI